jgi:putative tryptophan/tyrosine transport system substrate-binding protein
MRRREVIGGLGSAAVWPVVARAQPVNRTRRIGLLVSSASDDPVTQVRVAVFMQGLQEAGWVIGRNVQVDTRYGAGDAERLSAMAGELLALSPDLILAVGGPSLRALRATNRMTPVVFVGVIDPVGRGFVASLSQPGGNYTGFSGWEYGTAGKWLQLLKQIAPHVTRVAVTLSPAQSAGGGQLGAVQAVASLLNAEVTPIDDSKPGAFERGIDAFARGANDGLVVTGSTRASLQRNRIIAVAAQRKLPAVYPDRSYVADGGLLSYGPELLPVYRLAASYADRILKGEKPADLPVQAPTKFELVINLKTANALGLTIPETLLATADEVIQ